MARSPEASPLKRGGSYKTNPEFIELCSDFAEIDAYYGETLYPLLPRRLANLVRPLLRAA